MRLVPVLAVMVKPWDIINFIIIPLGMWMFILVLEPRVRYIFLYHNWPWNISLMALIQMVKSRINTLCWNTFTLCQPNLSSRSRYKITVKFVWNALVTCCDWSSCKNRTATETVLRHRAHIALMCSLHQCFSTFLRPRTRKFLFHKTRALSQKIYSSVDLLVSNFPIFLKFIH